MLSSSLNNLLVYTLPNLVHFLALVLQFKLEFVMPVIQPLDLLFHLSLLFLCVGDLEERLDLGEQTPPLPVPQLQVALYVALDDADGSVLLHALLVGPG